MAQHLKDSQRVVAQAPPEGEADLIARAQADRAAFGALYDRYIDTIYGYIYRQVGDHPAAQDVTAETFRRALERLGNYTWQGKPFGVWLLRIAQFVLRERRRAAHTDDLRTAPIPEDDNIPDGEAPALDDLVAREEAATLWRLVGTLAPDHQRILVWRYARDWDYAQIAPRVGRTPAACKQIAYRALRALRQVALASGEWPERGDGYAQ